jgi:hypothetical protein
MKLLRLRVKQRQLLAICRLSATYQLSPCRKTRSLSACPSAADTPSVFNPGFLLKRPRIGI